MAPLTRAYRAGESLEDFCRACKTDRLHTVIVADTEGRPIRVSCGFCHSEHNYRGGARIGVETGGTRAGTAPTSSSAPRSRSASDPDPFPIVSDRESTNPHMSLDHDAHLQMLLAPIIRDEYG